MESGMNKSAAIWTLMSLLLLGEPAAADSNQFAICFLETSKLTGSQRRAAYQRAYPVMEREYEL
jgi:hypothetical protein